MMNLHFISNYQKQPANTETEEA